MMVLNLLSVCAIIFLGILASMTDCRFHIVRNNHIIPFLFLGIVFRVLSIIIVPETAILDLRNMAFALGTSIGFYAARIWAAGDAKLFFVVSLLCPYELLVEGFGIRYPALFLLGIIFTLALLYVVVESAVLFIRDRMRLIPIKQIVWKSIFQWDMILSSIMCYFLIETVDSFLILLSQNAIMRQPFLLIVFHLLLVSAGISLIKQRKWMILVSAGLSAIRIAGILLWKFPMLQLSVSTVLMILVLLVLRHFTGQYDYRAIPATQVSEGQILAQSAVALFLLSNASSLPAWTDETTRCRLTESEAEAIRQWASKRKEQFSIMIVRNIPFAPFICGGVLSGVAICFFVNMG